MAIGQNLSIQQKQRLSEYFKCKNDPVYFIQNYVKLSLAGGDTLINLYDRQKDFINDILKEHYIIVLKSRQTGVSTITQMLCAWIVTFYKNAVIGCVSKSGPESTDFCRKVLSIIDGLPEWIRPKFSKRAEQSFITDNGCQFYAGQVDESNPEGLFRGKSLTALIVDEGAFIPKVDDAYTGVAPALFKSQTMAKQNNVPFFTVIISTPNKTVGKGKWYYQTWMKAINDDSIFKPFKLHWKMIKEFADDPLWYKTQCALLDNIHWKIAQELEMQFVASNNSFLPAETIEDLNTGTLDPVYKMKLKEKHDLWQWEQAERHKFYLIGIDTASSSGSDSSSIVVVDFESMTQVAEFKGKLRVDDFCDLISSVTQIYPNNLIIPEANSYGNQICEYLTKSDSFYNIYVSKVKSANITTTTTKNKKYKYGLTTGPQNRPLMIDSLYTHVVENPSIIKSERLALELIGLVDNGKGKIQADDGEHDDLVMALAFCAYVRLYDPPLAMSRDMNNKSVIDDMKDVSNWNNAKQSNISSEFSELKDFESGDVFERMEHANLLLNKHVKSNLRKIIDENNGGTTIDILKLLDLRNQKNQQM